MAKAIEYLYQALELDPEFALAWAELSRAHSMGADMLGPPWQRAMRVPKRRRRGPSSSSPISSRGTCDWDGFQINGEWDFHGAEASFTRALELAPRDPSALRAAGVLAGNLRPFRGCDCAPAQAIEQDPLSDSEL
jgi:tetratricopeptide (TPR) repeat protein